MPKSKKRKKNLTPTQTAIKKAERQLQTAQNITQGLLIVKEKTSPSYIPLVLSKLHNNNEITEIINPNPFPSDFHKMKSASLWPSNDFKRDALWMASSISVYRNELIQFSLLKEKFENYILLSDHSSAQNTLNTIEEQFGKSFWLIENKLLLLNKLGGAEELVSFSKSITDNRNNNFLVNLITYFLKLRTDVNFSPSKLNGIIDDFCIDFGTNDIDRAYIKFHVFPFDEIECPDISDVLNKGNNSAIIDQYMSLCNFIRIMFSWPQYESYKASLFPVLQQLSEWVPDRSIQNLICVLGITGKHLSLDNKSEQVISGFDNYTIGEYTQSSKEFSALIKENPEFVELYEGIIKTQFYLDDDKDKKVSSLKDELLDLMHQVYVKSNSFDTSRAKLLKIVMLHSSHPWCCHILSFVRRDGRKQWQEDMHPYTIQSGLSSRIFNPWQEQVFSNLNPANNFWDLIRAEHPNSTTIKLQDIQSLSTSDFRKQIQTLGIPEDRVKKYTCFKLLQDEKFEEAVLILEPLIRTESRDANYYDALRYLADCYKMSNRVHDCMELTVQAYLENSYVCSFLPITELINTIEKDHLNQQSSNITWPILNEIFYRHFTDSIEDTRSDAYMDFIDANGVERPSDIDFNKYPQDLAIWFLRNVCILNVLEASVTFLSSEDMFQERIKIYRILGQLDPDNSREYLSETAALNEQIAIRKLIRQVEQSKIYVDVEGIKSKLDKTFEDKYNRYVELANNPKLDAWSATFVHKIIEQISNQKDLSQFMVPPKETDYILANLLSDLTDKFISSTDFGLDFYISTRIRHGTLSGQLRGSLDSLNLLTTKDASEKEYKDNEHWETILYRLPVSARNKLQNLLKTFSQEIDDWIDTLKDEWFQIKKTSKDKGLFDYSDINAIHRQVRLKLNTATINYDDFLDCIFDELWITTEKNLENIRQKLKDDFEPAIINLLTELRRDAQDIIGLNYDDHGFAMTTTTAMTDFQNSVDRVIEWFRISRSKDTPDTSIRTAVALSIDSINSYDPRHELQPEIEIIPEDDIIIRGEWISSFTDIFLILLHNIKVHSHIENKAPDMKIKIFNDSKHINMTFSNELNNSIKINEVEKRLKSALDYKNITEIVRKEGGSGLPKLHKILKMDMKCNPKFQTNIANGWLTIQITLEHDKVIT